MSTRAVQKPEQPLVTVVVPAYNRATLIAQSIDSALAQTYPNVEIVIVDDGSTDNTEQVVRDRYGAKVRFLKQQNAGPAVARNHGIAEAKGDLIALLDSDDLWAPDKLARQIPHLLDGTPRIVTCGVEWFNTDTGAPTAAYIPKAGMTFHDVLGFDLLAPQSLLFPKSVNDAIGGSDSSLRGPEDWDFNLRATARFPIAVVPEVLVRIRNHGDQLSGDKTKLYNQCLRVLEKNKNLHTNCPDCLAARKRALARMRSFHYQFLNAKAKQALRQHDYGAAVSFSLKAFKNDPAAVLRIPARLISK